MAAKSNSRLEDLVTYKIRWELISRKYMWAWEWCSHVFHIYLEDTEDTDSCGLIERIWLDHCTHKLTAAGALIHTRSTKDQDSQNARMDGSTCNIPPLAKDLFSGVVKGQSVYFENPWGAIHEPVNFNIPIYFRHNEVDRMSFRRTSWSGRKVVYVRGSRVGISVEEMKVEVLI